MELGQTGTRTVLSLRVCVLRSDGRLLRKITPKNFRELSVEFPELFAREKEQERREATDVD